MKTALVTTTINVPTVLRLYRKLDPTVRFFIAGDQKSPHRDIEAICKDIGNAVYFHPQDHEAWKCSAKLPWNSIQRRNIATLEALAWGADWIWTADDDNIAVDNNYFHNELTYDKASPHLFFRGIAISSFTGWFDPGQLLSPPARQRGFPISVRSVWEAKSIVDARVGVIAGTCLGDPDVGAVDRISQAPSVHAVSELLRAGVVVDPQTFTVFNSQNTAFLRALAPAMFMVPHVGRYDDIYASLITQRVMRELNLYVHHGQPFAYQQRNSHDLNEDLRNEIFGMARIEKLGAYLNNLRFAKNTAVIDMVYNIFLGVQGKNLVPDEAIECADAWLEDCRTVLS